jgi:hypothetical protein
MNAVQSYRTQRRGLHLTILTEGNTDSDIFDSINFIVATLIGSRISERNWFVCENSLDDVFLAYAVTYIIMFINSLRTINIMYW